MFLEPAGTGEIPVESSRADIQRWGVSCETGRLTDVLVSAPVYLSMVPCNAVTRDSLAKGLFASPAEAARQHRALVEVLEEASVRCHFVPPAPEMADLTFVRDAVLMSPWGLIQLRPAANHRRSEPPYVAAALCRAGIPMLDRIAEGTIEGGDVCLLRNGVVAIGYSGDRTNETGARALAALFEQRGWEAILTRFDPEFLHLDTVFTMVSDACAVACTAALDDAFLAEIARLQIGIIPATAREVSRLGANLLSLGDGRIVAPADNGPLNRILERSGFEVIPVEIDQLTRCGGGVHCLTLPLARRSQAPPE